MATLLILVFGMVLGVAFVCFLLLLHFLRSARLAAHQPPHRNNTPPRSWRVQNLIPGTPCRWLAIRTTNIQSVQATLRLHKPAPCSWEEGLTAAHEQKLFISPPIAGWVLVLGTNLPDPAEDIDKCFHFIVNLSRKLGHVQFFSFNRVVNHHAWAQADQGQIIRAYAWAGHTLWNQGRMTRAEIDLRMKSFDYGDPPDRLHFAHGSAASLNTERVTLLAARWSIDPSTINARALRENHGITGELSQTQTS